MFWADKIADEFLAEYEKLGRELILRDEKTLSGRPHVGSLRSFVLHATLSDVLSERKVPHNYFYEINDTDAFDSVPGYVPEEWKEHLGKRLGDVPSPDGKAESYAMFFAKEYTDVLTDAGYNVAFYRSSERYAAGEFDQYIRLALDNKDKIRDIYKEVSGSVKDESWYPCQVICDECGKIATTVILNWDGEEVEYSCSADRKYVQGCGHKGKKSPFGGNATMPWKVEWAAKFCVVGVDLEGAGKDHYAAGGSRHVSNRICEEIFEHKHPFDVRHEFILIEGGKMSSSAGTGATAKELYELLPRYIFRFLMVHKDVMKTINFNPEGDTIPVLFDQYDAVLKGFLSDEEADALRQQQNRFIEMTHYGEDLSKLERFLPRFSQVAFYVQIPHVDIFKKFEEIKGEPLTDLDWAELELRIKYAKKWLETWSPEKYLFKIQEILPAEAADFSDEQKKFAHALAEFLKGNAKANGEEIQGFIYEKKNEMGIEARDIFAVIYISILGRSNGPKAGWLLEALDREFLIKRFSEL